jgi:hypothetical protein
MDLDLGLALQILTLLVAAVGPFLAYQYARKLALSGNKQVWLDALRADVAEFIALRDALQIHSDAQATPERADNMRDLAAKIQSLRYRIHLRLRTGNSRHDRLKVAVDQFLMVKDEPKRSTARAEVAAAAEDVLQHVWRQIESGRKPKRAN